MTTTQTPPPKRSETKPSRTRPGLATLSETLDDVSEAVENRKSSLQTLTTYPCGVAVSHDKLKGCYRIHFDPKMDENEFIAFFTEKPKPLLIERHQLQGPEARFHYQPATRDWEMRYRYHARDAEGQDIMNEEGKPTWTSCHKQVQTIANRIADKAAGLLSEKLGLGPQSAPIPD